MGIRTDFLVQPETTVQGSLMVAVHCITAEVPDAIARHQRDIPSFVFCCVPGMCSMLELCEQIEGLSLVSLEGP